ncbi:MAG: T9SS type A sorting domain-containing protein [Candidatus Electryonea clarkiae]|nr:T9SS type A sorting domain-containing protein [Candidatus Electryonea clarkiae]
MRTRIVGLLTGISVLFVLQNTSLAEIVGDTIVVGHTYYDSQHNGTVGRMIGYYPEPYTIGNDTVDGAAFFTWTRLRTYPDYGPRHVGFNIAGILDNGEYVIAYPDSGGGIDIDGMWRAGYSTLAMDSENGNAYPVYHACTGDEDFFRDYFGYESENMPYSWSRIPIPEYRENENIWPHAAFGEYEGTKYIHVVTTQQIYDPDMLLDNDTCYSRHEFDEDERVMIVNEQELVTEHGMNCTAEIAVSNDGSRVAIAVSPNRLFTRREGLHWTYPTNRNNDLWIWISDDGGETWEWEEPLDLTNFYASEIGPPVSDTFRVYTDCNLYFDQNDVLHAAFTTPKFYLWEEQLSNRAFIYHWDEVTNVFTVMADGMFFNAGWFGVRQTTVQRPSMYQDPVTGVLWCVHQRYGVPGDSNDVSDEGYLNSEVFVTASPPDMDNGQYYGLLWAEGVNITNTRYTGEGGAPAGQCRSEREPNIALNNDGDYLNIMYVLDKNAGFSREDEGEYTNNPVIWHRVEKDELIDLFDENAAWVENYPIHLDSTQHWEDSLDWDWEAHGGSFFLGENVIDQDQINEIPESFSIKSVYPNPFNSSLTIRVFLPEATHLKLKVYNILSREVAVLSDQQQTAGYRKFNFDGKELPSGIYFIYAKVPEKMAVVRKVVLLR